jgi:short-subunit dehydrogenase
MDRAQSAEHARTVVITGATAGIGRAVVRGFAARGDRLALIARGEEGLARAAVTMARTAAWTTARTHAASSCGPPSDTARWAPPRCSPPPP